MKKYLFTILVLLITVPVMGQSYGAQTLRHIYEIQSATTVLDGSNAQTNIPLEFSLPESMGEHGNSFGSFTVWVRADTLKADVSAADSLQLWYTEIKCDGNQSSSTIYTTSYYDSTQITDDLDWVSGEWKKYTITPDVCCGLEFHVKHITEADDSVSVQIDLDYQ